MQCIITVKDVLSRLKNEVILGVHQLESMICANIRFQLAKLLPSKRIAGGLVYDGTGVGKTLKFLLIMVMMALETGNQALVVFPNTVTKTWKDEWNKFFRSTNHSNFGLRTLTINSIKKDMSIYENSEIIGIPYHIFSTINKTRYFSSFLEKKFSVIVFDEAHTCTRKQALKYQNVRKLRCEMVWMGTANSASTSQYAQMCRTIIVMTEDVHDDELCPKEYLKRENPLKLISAVQQSGDLPPLVKEIIISNPNKGESKVLESIRDYCLSRSIDVAMWSTMQSSITSIFKLKDDDLSNSAKKLVNHIQQNDPTTHMKHFFRHSMVEIKGATIEMSPSIRSLIFDKTRGLLAVLKKDKTNKVLIFTRYNFEVQQLKMYLSEWQRNKKTQFVCVTGSTSQSERAAYISNFNTSSEYRIMIMNQQCGEVGLNIQAANYVYSILVDTNPMKDMQSISRVYRQGQKRVVTWYHVCLCSLIEEMNIEKQNKHMKTKRLTENNKNLNMNNELNECIDEHKRRRLD